MSSGQGADLPQPTPVETGDSQQETSSQPAPRVKSEPTVSSDVYAAHAGGDTSVTMKALAGEEISQTNPSPVENVTPRRIADLEGMLRRIKDGTRSGQLDVKVGDTLIKLEYKDALGNGGSKSVRRIVLDGQEYALGLPNATDTAATMLEKWSNVQREPANTERMRELGFLTNPVCRLVPIEINGVPFEAVLMLPYDRLPYEIRDGKTAREAIDPATGLPRPELHDLLPATLDSTGFREAMQGVVQDVARLAQNGVRIALDSFNVAVVDGKVRLYFNDLGTARFGEQPSNLAANCKSYVADAIRTVLGVMSNRELRTHESFLNSTAFDSTNQDNLYDQLTEDVLGTISASE